MTLRTLPLCLLYFVLIVPHIGARQSGAVFLEFPSSVRAGGMGESFTALADEPLGINYNPAGIGLTKFPEFSLIYQSYIQDFSATYIGFSIPWKAIAFGVAPSLVAMKDEPVYDSLGLDTGRKFGYRGVAVPFAVATHSGGLSFGLGIKYVSEQIDDYSDSATTVDLGVMRDFGNLRIGVSGLNLTGALGGYPLPKTIKAGAAYLYKGAVFSTEYDRQLIKEENIVAFGADIPVVKTLQLRAGYTTGKNINRLSAGFGIKLNKFNFDYAFSSYGDFGNTHRAGFTTLFEGPSRTAASAEIPVAPIATPAPLPPALPEKRNLAVSDFAGKNVSAADASIVSDLIRGDLVNSSGFNVMDRTNMEMILAEQKFQLSGCTEQECAVKIGKLLNVHRMVVGSLSKLLNTYYITASLVDVETGKILRSVDEKAMSADELRDACRIVASKIIR